MSISMQSNLSLSRSTDKITPFGTYILVLVHPYCSSFCLISPFQSLSILCIFSQYAEILFALHETVFLPIAYLILSLRENSCFTMFTPWCLHHELHSYHCHVNAMTNKETKLKNWDSQGTLCPRNPGTFSSGVLIFIFSYVLFITIFSGLSLDE